MEKKEIKKPNMLIDLVTNKDAGKWHGRKIKFVQYDTIMEVFSIPEDKTIEQCISEKSFDPTKHIDFETFRINQNRFTLITEEDAN